MAEDSHFKKLVDAQKRSGVQEVWICKPGENANRGRGITVLKGIEAVQKLLQSTKPGENWVVQKYIYNPLLIGGPHWLNSPMRKFDIRAFGVV